MAVSRVSAANYYTQAALTSPVSVSVALAALKANPKAGIKISDTSENISRNLETLNAYANNLTEIAQTDATTPISVTEAQFNRYGKLLSKFSSSYLLNVTNARAASASTLAANSHVTALSITDSSANVSLKLDTLQGLDAGLISKIT